MALVRMGKDLSRTVLGETFKSQLKFSMCAPGAKARDSGGVEWSGQSPLCFPCHHLLTGEERLGHSLHLIQSIAQFVDGPLLASGSSGLAGSRQ